MVAASNDRVQVWFLAAKEQAERAGSGRRKATLAHAERCNAAHGPCSICGNGGRTAAIPYPCLIYVNMQSPHAPPFTSHASRGRQVAHREPHHGRLLGTAEEYITTSPREVKPPYQGVVV
ncbi:hypothetical protein PSPO01_05326 [Paraphaeosphaeria sporulosa]